MQTGNLIPDNPHAYTFIDLWMYMDEYTKLLKFMLNQNKLK